MYAGDEIYGDDVTSGLSLEERLAGARSTRLAWPAPTTDEPDLETLEEWSADGGCEATDGCWVEPDGTCEHLHPSWLLQLGMI
jgi:hypothetical protein